jgi:nucleotide-binding universal stress UspA family protein
MSFRTLLVPLFGAAHDRRALDAALSVARGFDSHVEAVFARPDPRDSIPILGEGVSGTMVEEIMKAAENDAGIHRNEARRHFDDAIAAAEARVAEAPPAEPAMTARWSELRGRPEDLIPVEGRLADLVVLAAPERDEEGTVALTGEYTLLGSGRPLLYVGSRVPEYIGRRVAIAWNGRPESARATALAMPFLEDAATVHVLTAETALTQGGAGRRLVDHLGWHRVRASLVTLPQGSQPVGKLLMDKAEALGCDLLVMGGYGHSRMREMILGGVTRHVLAHPGVPVFMAH